MCSSASGQCRPLLLSLFAIVPALCTTSDAAALTKTNFQRIDPPSLAPPFIFDVSATLNAISLDIKWNKPSTCCSFNSCVGNREMEMSAARFTAGGQEKKWLLYCLWLKNCFKYIILSFCKSSISILERNNTFNVCKDTFTVIFFFLHSYSPMRFQISLHPYVTIPVLSKDRMAELAVPV